MNFIQKYFIQRSTTDELLTYNSDLQASIRFLLTAIEQKAEPTLVFKDWDRFREMSNSKLSKRYF